MRLATALLTIVIVGLVGLGTLLDGLIAPAASVAREAGPVDVRSGGWTCATGDGRGLSELTVLAVSPPGEEGRPATLSAEVFGDGETVARESDQVFPGSAVARPVEVPGDDLGVFVRWWDVPAAVFRLWQVEETTAPSGRVVGPCRQRPSARWTVPGLATAGGAQATLVLANPFGSPAAVSIVLTTPEGPIAPRRLANVVVPERAVTEVLLNEHAPEHEDLGVLVETRSGRVVVEAVQTFDAAIGGIEGTSLVGAAPAPSEAWTVPWIGTAQGTSGWIWVTNPSDAPAAVTFALHSPAGGIVPEDVEELTLEPGQTRRVDLTGLVPPETPHTGVTVRSDNAVPIVVSGATRHANEDPARTGVTVTLGAPALDQRWVLATAATAGRQTVLDLANPEAEPAEVAVSVWTAEGLVRPSELSRLHVPAGGSRGIDVTELLAAAGDGPVAIFVDATVGAVAAGLRGSSIEGRREAVAFVGVPAGTFRTDGARAGGEYSPDLLNRLGTPLGPRPSEELLPEVDAQPFDADQPLPVPASPSP